MVKVIGLNKVAEIAEKEALRRKIEKEFLDQKIKEAVDSGVEEKVAKVMVQSMWECGVYNI